MYVSMYSLFNIYMYLISYLYAPASDGMDDMQYNQTRKEHEHIMNQFYESELPDISKENYTSKHEPKRGKYKNVDKRRRDQKKDPKEKAKEVSTI